MCVSYVKLCFLVAIKQCLVIQFVNCWMYGSRKQWFGYMLYPNTLIDKDNSVRTPGVSTNKCDVYFLNDCFWNFWLSEKNVCSYRCVCVCVREITQITTSYTQGIQKTISEHRNNTKGRTLKQTDYNIRCWSCQLKTEKPKLDNKRFKDFVWSVKSWLAFIPSLPLSARVLLLTIGCTILIFWWLLPSGQQAIHSHI